MPDVKISALPAATSVAATDVAPIVAGGTVTQKATAAQIVKGALDAAPVTVAQGGTGATTAAAAQTALNVPSRTGAGATGTWGISVTGTAQKATDLANGVAGDLPYQSGDTATEFLPIGSAGQVLTVANGLPSWATPASGGVSQIIAGTNVTISPAGGTGAVTINASGGGGGSLSGVTQGTTPFLTSLGGNANTAATGLNNTFIGTNAGKLITTGPNNTAVGTDALATATTAAYNTCIGDGAGQLLTGGSNTIVGQDAMKSASTGSQNTVIGCQAGEVLTGTGNVIIGYQTGDLIGNVANSVCIGQQAGGAWSTGTNGTVAIGYASLNALTSGGSNTALGTTAGQNNQTGSFNTYIGYGAALNATGSNGTFLGANTATNLTTGAGNTFIGNGAGRTVTTGGNNTLVGNYAGVAALTGACILSDGAGNIRFATNSTGALSFDNTNFGSTSHVLKSNGTGAAPSWGQANKVPTLNISTDTTILASSIYAVEFVNANSNSLTVTLPQATGNAGLQFTLKRVDGNTANTVTVASLGGNIEGAATQTLGIGIAVLYCSDGTNWWELANS